MIEHWYLARKIIVTSPLFRGGAYKSIWKLTDYLAYRWYTCMFRIIYPNKHEGIFIFCHAFPWADSNDRV